MKRILSLLVLLVSICFVADAQYKLKYQYTSTSYPQYFDVDENLKVSFDENTIYFNDRAFAFGEETKIRFVLQESEISLNKSELLLNVGEEVQLIATEIPEEDASSLRWRSQEETIAAVSAEGIVKAVSPGETWIYAECGDITGKCYVRVFSETDLEVLARERQALIDFYNATDGDHWINNENWCSDKPLSEWYGVYTDIYSGHVMYIQIFNNNLNGEIPESFGDLSELRTIDLSENNLSGRIPESLGNLKKLDGINLALNSFSGEFPKFLCKIESLTNICLTACGLTGEIPEEIGYMPALEYLLLCVNQLSGPIPESFKNLKNLKELIINDNPLNCEIPEWIGELTNLTHIILSQSGLTGTIPNSIGNLVNLCDFDVENNNLTGMVPASLWALPELKQVILNGNQFSGIEPESTDYSRDGEVVVLQKATVGKGVDLVFMGDGFLDVDIESGRYDQRMRWGMESFFDYEPYKSLRDRFNVYYVTAVSANSHIFEGSDVAINYSVEKSINYAIKIPDINQNELHVCVITSPDYFIGTSYTVMMMDGSYIAYIMEPNANTLQHEVGGHGIGRLADEYYHGGEFTNFEGLDYDHSNDYFLNVDYHSSPNEVLWKHFMNDSRYEGQVGIYEGACAHYCKGIFRSTEHSIMRYHDIDSTYNAPSREAIYKIVMKASKDEDWKYDYEEFVKYDEINRNATTRANYVEKLPEVDVENWKRHHKSPVFINKTWREVVEGK